MNIKKVIFALFLSLILLTISSSIIEARSYRSSPSDVYVRGYFRKNGTYVSPYYRSHPDGIISNNYSCIDYGRCGSSSYGSYVGPSFSDGLSNYDSSGISAQSIPFYTPTTGLNRSSSSCYDSASMPYSVIATAIGNKKANIQWFTSGSYDYATIYYSDDLLSKKYSVPNAGNQNNLTIGELTPGKIYYFWIQIKNGCAYSNFSSYASVIAR